MFMKFICTPGLLFFFFMEHFLVFIELVTILLLFAFLFLWPWGIQDLRYLTKDWIRTGCMGRWSLKLWTARKVPWTCFWHSSCFAHTYSLLIGQAFSLESCNFPMLLQDSNKTDNTLTVYVCLSPNTQTLDTHSCSKFNHMKCPLCEYKAVKSQQVYAVSANTFGL